MTITSASLAPRSPEGPHPISAADDAPAISPSAPRRVSVLTVIFASPSRRAARTPV